VILGSSKGSFTSMNRAPSASALGGEVCRFGLEALQDRAPVLPQLPGSRYAVHLLRVQPPLDRHEYVGCFFSRDDPDAGPSARRSETPDLRARGARGGVVNANLRTTGWCCHTAEYLPLLLTAGADRAADFGSDIEAHIAVGWLLEVGQLALGFQMSNDGVEVDVA